MFVIVRHRLSLQPEPSNPSKFCVLLPRHDGRRGLVRRSGVLGTPETATAFSMRWPTSLHDSGPSGLCVSRRSFGNADQARRTIRTVYVNVCRCIVMYRNVLIFAPESFAAAYMVSPISRHAGSLQSWRYAVAHRERSWATLGGFCYGRATTSEGSTRSRRYRRAEAPIRVGRRRVLVAKEHHTSSSRTPARPPPSDSAIRRRLIPVLAERQSEVFGPPIVGPFAPPEQGESPKAGHRRTG